MTYKGMPEKIWAIDARKRPDDSPSGVWSERNFSSRACYIRADIVEELLMTLEWYNDGRDPVVSEVMSRINAIMEGK